MQKGNMVIIMVLTLSLVSITISVKESFAQSVPDAFLSNVILVPDNTGTAEATQATIEPMITMITLTSENDEVSESIPTSEANKRGQSPFVQVAPGMYNIDIEIPEGYALMSAVCKYQKPNGKWISIGEWHEESTTVSGVDLTSQKAHKCTWKLELQSATLPDEIPVELAEVQKFLEIKGDPASANAIYKVVVTGKITPGPNANPADKISSNKMTVNGSVWTTGTDDYYFTGDIVSITANNHIFSFVDGVEVPNDSSTAN